MRYIFGFVLFSKCCMANPNIKYVNDIKKNCKQNPICHFRRVNGETKCNNLFSLYFLRNIREISLLKKIISEYEVA